MKPFTILWKFSRPHTVIGSIISICTLYVIVCEKDEIRHLSLLALALIIGISCNIFIVGINQIADVNIDKINKPYLPIASGALIMEHAKIIVYTALIISLGLALYISPYLFCIIAFSTAIGWMYSMPPLHLKQHHLSATLAITTVRGLVINLGGFLVFNYLVNNSLEIPMNVRILTLFITAFSIVISWFKDLPDVEGDAKYNIRTLAILYSPKAALLAGNLLLAAAYLFTICMKSVDFFALKTPSFETITLLYGHIALFSLFIINAFSVTLEKHQSVKKFYRRFWWFFFAEYALYMVAYIIKT
ncbi:MAG TPA: homogentisate phytyltransferase [Bacteroidia bacterium]|nr:homogentisate phytyltransferase [Bacteroidia bacterium]